MSDAISPEGSPQKIEPDMHTLLTEFIHSFRHSRGSVPLQKDLFVWLHIVHPEWNMSEKLTNKLQEVAFEPIQRILNPEKKQHVETDLTQTKKFIEESSLDMQDALNSDVFPKASLDDLIESIAKQMIQRDLKFEVTPNSPDPYSVYIVKYALKRESTGVEEFDTLYGKVGEYLRNSYKNNTSGDLEKLVARYNKTHQDAQFFLYE